MNGDGLMSKRLEEATREIAEYRDDIIKRLMKYIETDALLFWGEDKDLIACQEKKWKPLLEWAKQEFDTKFQISHDLEVKEENQKSGYRLKFFLEHLSDKELAAFYLAALNMRSVLMAAALVKGRITAKQAYEAAYLEELWQAEKWGVDEEAEKKRQERYQELKEVEDFLKK